MWTTVTRPALTNIMYVYVTQARLEAHVKNVRLFDHLLHVQMDWLSDTEARLALLRRASKVFTRVQQQLDEFQVQFSSVVHDSCTQ